MTSESKPYPPESEMNPYYIGVGRISAALAHLELRISYTIWELANVEQYIGACITAQFIAPAPRLQALAALIAQRGASEAIVKELNQISVDIRAIAGERNRVSHDPGFLNPDDDESYLRLEITADKKLKFGMQPDALAHMERLEAKINSVTARFDDWRTRALQTLPPFPRTQFARSPGIGLDAPPDQSNDPQEP